jgi:protein-S-isoprenylcysteine O-methyltransferase Ste14
MIEWLNLILLFVSMFVSLYFYLKSVQPAKLELEIGEIAYEKCARFRIYASIPFALFFVCYAIYIFYPIPLPFSQAFPWDYWISLLLAIVIGVPAIGMMYIGVRDAGEETFSPKKEHEMYGGIYEKVRHPQSLGEVWVGHVFALILNSTFLFLFSFLWFPVFYYMVVVEERDLILRYGEKYLEYRKRVGMFIPKRSSS